MIEDDIDDHDAIYNVVKMKQISIKDNEFKYHWNLSHARNERSQGIKATYNS